MWPFNGSLHAEIQARKDAHLASVEYMAYVIASLRLQLAERAVENLNLKSQHIDDRRILAAQQDEKVKRLTSEIDQLKGTLEERERWARIGRMILQDHDWQRGGRYNHNGREGVLWNAVDTRVDKMSDFRIGLPEGESPRQEIV